MILRLGIITDAPYSVFSLTTPQPKRILQYKSNTETLYCSRVVAAIVASVLIGQVGVISNSSLRLTWLSMSLGMLSLATAL